MGTFSIQRNAQPLTSSTFTFSVANTQSTVRFFLYFHTYTGNVQVDWGDGVTNTSATINSYQHTYASPYTGNISVTIDAEYSEYKSFEDGNNVNSVNMICNFDISILSVLTNLDTVNFYSSIITGDISVFPSNMSRIFITGNNTVYGNIASLSSTIPHITISGNNTVSGDLTNALTDCVSLTIGGVNTVTGNIANFTALDLLSLYGNNTVSGNLEDLPNTARDIRIAGANIVGGNIENVTFTNFQYLVLEGNNTLTGSMTSATLPSNTITVKGNNTLSGDISLLSLPSFSINVEGNNTLSGEMGDIVTLTGCTITIKGNNTITTNFSALEKLATVDLGGNSSAGGDIGLIDTTTLATQLGVSVLLPNYTCIAGNPLSYTSRLWNTGGLTGFYFRLTISDPTSGNALSASELDQFLIDLNNSDFIKQSGSSRSRLVLTGAGWSRTTTSDVAVNALSTAGMILTIPSS